MNQFLPSTQQLTRLMRGIAQVVPEAELAQKLNQNRSLIIKLGADPTAPDLHLGHAVVLLKMREFQDLGHTVIFLIGDYTARIGDPAGKSKTRPPLSEEEIARNTQTYFKQVSRILDPKTLVIRYNSEWLDALSSKDFLKLCAQTTLARLTEREDFAKRIALRESIGFHELLYPLFQAYDSVALRADVELGGTDQTFNLLMGRYIQEQYGQEPQVIMTVPILEGLDGVQKMSKSLGNYIGLNESADQAFGKLMSINDTLMWRYMELLLPVSSEDLAIAKEEVTVGRAHPMDIKKKMAFGIVERFWSSEQAHQAQQTFENLFQNKDYSSAQPFAMPARASNPIKIVDLLKILNAVLSANEAKRLIGEGAVRVDDTKVADMHASIAWQPGTLIRVGKHRFFKLQ